MRPLAEAVSNMIRSGTNEVRSELCLSYRTLAADRGAPVSRSAESSLDNRSQ